MKARRLAVALGLAAPLVLWAALASADGGRRASSSRPAARPEPAPATAAAQLERAGSLDAHAGSPRAARAEARRAPASPEARHAVPGGGPAGQPAPAPTLLPLRVRLVDRLTREPVPSCAVRLGQTGRSAVECCSDAEGWIESRAAFAPGEVALDLLGGDAPRAADPLAFAAVPAAQGLSTLDGDVSIDVGPTYEVAFESPPPLPLSSLTAHLWIDGSDTTATTTLRTDGEPPWVRFPALPAGEPAEASATLAVQGATPPWRASAAVASIIGRSGAVVVLRADSTASVGGRVEDRAGAPVETRLFLTRVDAESPVLRTRSTTSDAEGSYAFDHVAPGSYGLEVADDRYEPWGERVEVASDAHVLVPATLDRALRGEVTGTLQSRTGTYALPLTMALERDDGSRPYTLAVDRWLEQDGRLVAPFAFEDVRPGEYRIRLQASGGFPWEPPDLRVRAPSSAHLLLCLDDAMTRAIGFALRDAATGHALPQYGVEVRAVGSDGAEQLSRIRSFPTDAPLMRILPGETELAWSLRVPGFRPAYGTTADFRGALEADALWCAQVRLQRGWGVELEVRTGSGGSSVPLEGARVLLDGRLAGTTDAQGLARLEDDEPPRQIEVLHRDWRLAGGDVDEGGVSLRGVIARATVWMAAP